MDYFLGIDATTGTLVADFEDTATARNHPVTGTTAVTSNVWHHAAAVYDTATDTWQLYLDGTLDRTLALGGNFTPESTSVQHAAHRQRADLQRHRRRLLPGRRSTRCGSGTSRARGAQIQAARTQELTSGTGLIGRYGLNEGSGTTASPASPAPRRARSIAGATWTTGAPFSGGGSGATPPTALNAPADAATGTAPRSRSRRRAPTPTAPR